MAASAKSAVWFKSDEPPSKVTHPSASVLGVACKEGRKLVVVVGTEFPMKKTFSITPPLTDVRYYFDDEDSHRNWEAFGPAEAGPIAFLSGFTNSMTTSRVLKVAFEREGKAERETVTFRLDEPDMRGRLVALLKACQ